MKRIVWMVLGGVSVFLGCAQGPLARGGALKAPGALTAEYLANPVGLDCAAPRLSWKLSARSAKARDLRQAAYQIQVATRVAALTSGAPDLWDSGRVASGQSLNVAYAGKPLASSQRCYWRVRAWDNTGDTPSAWSAPARWVMGVMRPAEWQAQWIGANASTRPDCDLAGAKWIWAGDAASLGQAAPGKRHFRKVFGAPQGAGGAPVLLAVTADDE